MQVELCGRFGVGRGFNQFINAGKSAQEGEQGFPYLEDDGSAAGLDHWQVSDELDGVAEALLVVDEKCFAGEVGAIPAGLIVSVRIGEYREVGMAAPLIFFEAFGEVPGQKQSEREVPVGLGVIGVDANCVSVILECLLVSAHCIEGDAEMVAGLGVVGRQLDGPFIAFDGLCVPAELFEGEAHGVMGLRGIGHEGCSLGALIYGGGVVGLCDKGDCHVVAGFGVIGFECEGVLVGFECLVGSAEGLQYDAAGIVKLRIFGIYFDGFGEQVERQFAAAGLRGYHRERVEAEGMVGADLEKQIVEVLGLGEATGLMVLHGVLDDSANIGHTTSPRDSAVSSTGIHLYQHIDRVFRDEQLGLVNVDGGGVGR